MSDRSGDQYKKWSEHRLLAGIITILQDWFYNAFSGVAPFTEIIMRGLISDAVSRILRVDASTNTLQTIDYVHHEIHGGGSYAIKSVADLALGTFIDIRITTPPAPLEAHFEAFLDVESETNWWLFEDVEIDTVGAVLLPLNRNRNSLNVSTLAFDIIQNANIGAANADTDITGITNPYLSGTIGSGKKSLGKEESRGELILLPDTIYSLRWEVVSAGYINYAIEYYEHTPRD